MPRIKMLKSKEDLPAEQHAEFDAITEFLGRVGGPFTILLHSPGLAEKVMRAGGQVRLGSTLSKIERQIIILVVARERNASYEWSVHARNGRTAGMSDDFIDLIRKNRPAAEMPAEYADLVRFVRQVLRHNEVDDGVFERLQKAHTDRWLVEAAGTVGQYQYISTITGVFKLEAPPVDDELLRLGEAPALADVSA